MKMAQDKQCICEYEELEQGNTLFKACYWDGGVDYHYIHDIKYCPKCGRLLPTEQEQEDGTNEKTSDR